MEIENGLADGVFIEVVGAELSQHEREHLFSGLAYLQNEAPSDASSRLTISNSDAGCELRLVIRSVARRFEVESLGAQFNEAFEGILGTCGRQLQMWQEERWSTL